MFEKTKLEEFRTRVDELLKDHYGLMLEGERAAWARGMTFYAYPDNAPSTTAFLIANATQLGIQ